MRSARRERAGFTLVELLVVIAIIALLVGILVPAINTARTQAKSAAAQAMLKGIGDACEAFSGEVGRYPHSRYEVLEDGGNPFMQRNSGERISGAQWLCLQLSGPDLGGYVKPVVQNDADGNGLIDEEDWAIWYALNAGATTRAFTRVGPYVPADGRKAMSPLRFREVYNFVGEVPESLRATGSGGNNRVVYGAGELPFYVDPFGFPVLYYLAESSAPHMVSTGEIMGSAGSTRGVYDQSDNSQFTGGPGGEGFYQDDEPGWDLGAGPEPSDPTRFHPFARLGYDPDNPEETVELPENTRSFGYSIMDRGLYEQTKGNRDHGRVWPIRPEGFMLITPGADARWGTLDDIRNF